MHSYLHPDDYFSKYAALLEVDVNILKETGELCNPVDKEKENLKISLENLEELEKTP